MAIKAVNIMNPVNSTSYSTTTRVKIFPLTAQTQFLMSKFGINLLFIDDNIIF